MGKAIIEKVVCEVGSISTDNYTDGPGYNDHGGDGGHTKDCS